MWAEWLGAATIILGLLVYALLWRYGGRLLGWLTAVETSLDADQERCDDQRVQPEPDGRVVTDINARLAAEMKRRRR